MEDKEKFTRDAVILPKIIEERGWGFWLLDDSFGPTEFETLFSLLPGGSVLAVTDFEPERAPIELPKNGEVVFMFHFERGGIIGITDTRDSFLMTTLYGDMSLIAAPKPILEAIFGSQSMTAEVWRSVDEIPNLTPKVLSIISEFRRL